MNLGLWHKRCVRAVFHDPYNMLREKNPQLKGKRCEQFLYSFLIVIEIHINNNKYWDKLC